MDPLHITEFASERYFTKLSQQNQQQNREGSAVEGPAVSVPLPPAQPSLFILPLRDSKPVEPDESPTQSSEPKQKRIRFGLSRILHSKSSQPAVIAAPGPLDTTRTSLAESFKPRRFVPLPSSLSVVFGAILR